MPLTAKQQRFAEEYVKDLNASQAAIRAGYAPKASRQAGAENLSKPNVAAEVERLRADRSKRTGIDATWLLARLAEEATADLADLYDDNGHIKPVKEWPLIWRQGLVAGLETETERPRGSRGTGQWRGQSQDVHDEEPPETETVITKVRLSDRVKRLELIGKHIGVKAFEETINVKGLEGLGEKLARAAERLKGE